ncbi:MAG: TOBE domain-containing protein, partial [Myxococcales bacterium]|nr:TOBE domain-containing protein [Myxococcales bacterium]
TEGVPTGRVDVVESHGAEAMVHVALTKRLQLVVRAPEPVTVTPGDDVGLAFDQVHRFEAASGRLLP